MARLITVGPGGTEPQGRADWWQAFYKPNGGQITWASNFHDAWSSAFNPAIANAFQGKKISSFEYQAQWVMVAANDEGWRLTPDSVIINRKVSTLIKLVPHGAGAGAISEALKRGTVNGAPIDSEPWILPALQEKFPDYFSGASGSRSAGTSLLDRSTSATLVLDLVEFRLNSPQQLSNTTRRAPAVNVVPPENPEPIVVEQGGGESPESRDLEQIFGTTSPSSSSGLVVTRDRSTLSRTEAQLSAAAGGAVLPSTAVDVGGAVLTESADNLAGDGLAPAIVASLPSVSPAGVAVIALGALALFGKKKRR